MAYEFYKSSLLTKQSPQSDWQESYQQASDDFWDNTSTVATIQSQSAVGSVEYGAESVQLTSIISPTTGESFGDRYRKIIHKSYLDADNYLGKMYQFDDYYWLTINTNTRIGSVKTSIVQQCNNLLKWVNNIGTISIWQCVYTRNISGTNFDFGSQGVPQIGADAKILVQRNASTDTIAFNQRFLFDGHAFQVKQIDNHYSDTLMALYIFEVPLQVDDDLVNGIASNKGEITPTTNETRILPNTTKILEGESISYSIYKYINGVANADTFSIVATQAPQANYTLSVADGNNFSITNIARSNIPLILTCTNNVSNEVTTLNIVLGGNW